VTASTGSCAGRPAGAQSAGTVDAALPGDAGERTRDCLAIIAVAVALLAALRPLQNTPFIDDWVYAHSVEVLLTQGRLSISDWSAHLNVVQVLWGALFCVPFGFSFTALRLSTWVLAVSALVGLYLVLRDAGVSRRPALLGTATLGFNPVFFVLGHTFMTDVPFLAATIWFMLAAARAVRQQDRRYLWTAAVLASLGVGVRTVGIAMPGALLATVLLCCGPWGRRPGDLAAPVTSIALGLMLVWVGLRSLDHVVDLSDIANAPANRVAYVLRYAIPWLPQMLVFGSTFVIVSVGTALLPLAVAAVEPPRAPATAALWAGLLTLVVVTSRFNPPYSPPLASGTTWALAELGATEPLIPHAAPAAQAPWVGWAVTVAATASFAVVLLAALRRRGRSAAEASFLWLALGHWTLIVLLWLFYDRYTLVFVPVAIAVLLGRCTQLRLLVAVPAVALFAALCCVGMHDHLALNGALWGAVGTLQARGVPAEQIDGGYVVNGWLQFAHPEHAPRDAQGRIVVPHMTVADWPLPYVISLRPLPGFRVLDSLPFLRYLAPAGLIYVLQRADSDASN